MDFFGQTEPGKMNRRELKEYHRMQNEVNKLKAQMKTYEDAIKRLEASGKVDLMKERMAWVEEGMRIQDNKQLIAVWQKIRDSNGLNY